MEAAEVAAATARWTSLTPAAMAISQGDDTRRPSYSLESIEVGSRLSIARAM